MKTAEEARQVMKAAGRKVEDKRPMIKRATNTIPWRPGSCKGILSLLWRMAANTPKASRKVISSKTLTVLFGDTFNKVLCSNPVFV